MVELQDKYEVSQIIRDNSLLEQRVVVRRNSFRDEAKQIELIEEDNRNHSLYIGLNHRLASRASRP